MHVEDSGEFAVCFAPGIELGLLGLAQAPYSESPAGPKKHF